MLAHVLDVLASTVAVKDIQVVAVKAGFYWFSVVGLICVRKYTKRRKR